MVNNSGISQQHQVGNLVGCLFNFLSKHSLNTNVALFYSIECNTFKKTRDDQGLTTNP